MKKYLIVFIVAACAGLLNGYTMYKPQYPQTNIGMVHDYIFQNSSKMCENHGGLHYIVSIQTITDGKDKDYPCTETFKVRCQDDTLLTYDGEIAWCFIPKMQLDETLEQE